MMYIPTMGGRVDYLQEAVDGYRATGKLMVSVLHGTVSAVAGGDDPGIYMAVPIVAKITGLGAAAAMELFQATLLVMALIIGCIASWRTFATREAKMLACAGVVGASVLSFGVADVYMFSPAFCAAVIPIVVTVLRKKQESVLIPALALIGVAAGLTNFLRSHAATGILLFILVLLVWKKWAPREKAWAAAALGAGLLISFAFTRIELQRRDAYIKSMVADYQPIPTHHALWGQMYIGFGFLTNPYVASYADDVGIQRIRAVSPGLDPYSEEGERVFRSEVFKLAAAHPWFTVRTIAAKIGVIVALYSVFIVCIVLARLQFGKFDPLDAAFIVAIAFYSIPGLVTIPTVQYLGGALATAVMYAAYATAIARDQLAQPDLRYV